MNDRVQRAQVQDIADQEYEHSRADTPALFARLLTRVSHTVLSSLLVEQRLCLAPLFENEDRRAK
jgi:hypothetical protein